MCLPLHGLVLISQQIINMFLITHPHEWTSELQGYVSTEDNNVKSVKNKQTEIFLNISSRFLVFPLPLKLRVLHMRKKIKNFDFLKKGSNDFD